MSRLLRHIIVGVFGVASGFAVGIVLDYENSREIIRKRENEIIRCKGYFNTLNQWLLLKQKDILIADYFLQRGCRIVAVYGLGELGQRLCRELYDAGIFVKYGIDKNADEKETGDFCDGIRIVDLDYKFSRVDAVIVTLPHVFRELRAALSEKFECPVFDLERVLFETEWETVSRNT